MDCWHPADEEVLVNVFFHNGLAYSSFSMLTEVARGTNDSVRRTSKPSSTSQLVLWSGHNEEEAYCCSSWKGPGVNAIEIKEAFS